MDWNMYRQRRTLIRGGGLVLVFGVLTMLMPNDYVYYIRATQSWMGGAKVYSTPRFFNAPWVLLFWAPFSVLPDRIGAALMNLLSLVAIWWAIRALTGKRVWWALWLALANIWTVNLLAANAIDGLLLSIVAWALSLIHI